MCKRRPVFLTRIYNTALSAESFRRKFSSTHPRDEKIKLETYDDLYIALYPSGSGMVGRFAGGVYPYRVGLSDVAGQTRVTVASKTSYKHIQPLILGSLILVMGIILLICQVSCSDAIVIDLPTSWLMFGLGAGVTAFMALALFLAGNRRWARIEQVLHEELGCTRATN